MTTEPFDLREQIARIDREFADAAHKRAMTGDIPKGATARTLTAGAALFAAGGAFVGAIVAVFKALGVF